MKTVTVACPEPPRRDPVTWATNTTTTGAGNVRVDWLRLDTAR